MSNFKQYRRTQIAEMADWAPGFDMSGVSVSEADRKAGSPRTGDKIARNPANHEDRWLVAADYFAANFEALASAPKQAQETSLPPQGAASPDPQLLKFYAVSDYPSLVAAMLRHIEKLQAKLPKDGQPLLTRVRA